MKTFFFSLLLGLMITVPTIAQEVENDFVLEGVHFERCNKSKDWCLVLDSKGKYERMDYPKLKFFINDKLVADTDQLYGIVLENGYSIETNLKEVPEDFELLIVVTALHRNVGGCFVYKTNRIEEREELEKDDFELKKVSLIKEGTQNFIRLDFKPFKEGAYWSYPMFIVEIDGKVVAERGSETYGLVRTELIPTELEELPTHFEAKVRLGMLNSEAKLVLEYKK